MKKNSGKNEFDFMRYRGVALATWARTILGRLVTFRSGGWYDEGPMSLVLLVLGLAQDLHRSGSGSAHA